MAKKHTSKRRQKALQRKAAKRKKRKRRAVSIPRGRRARLRAAGRWPLYECLISDEWRDTAGIAQILISRQGPSGEVAVGAFLVDLGCLGVKSAFGRITAMREYTELRSEMSRAQALIKADVNLAAKIVREAVAYAKELGFDPDPDYRDALLVLGDADPDACDEEIPLGGEDGKPLFVAGPYDNVDAIIPRLVRKLGPDGFRYIVPVGPFDETDW